MNRKVKSAIWFATLAQNSIGNSMVPVSIERIAISSTIPLEEVFLSIGGGGGGGLIAPIAMVVSALLCVSKGNVRVCDETKTVL